MSWATAALLAAVLAGAGRAAGWLTGPAAVTAAALGWVVLGGAGPRGLALVAVFFVTGSALTRPGPRPVGRRAAQVAANGWTAALGAALVPLAPDTGWAVLAGGMAAAQADTWATEIGMRGTARPILLTTGAPVPAGTSGGVTLLGTLGGAAGAAGLAAAAAVLGLAPRLALAAAAAGLAGLLADSLLGATAQAAYRCARCALRVDQSRHCDAPANRLSGTPWITNDAVNALATGAGALAAALLVAWWP